MRERAYGHDANPCVRTRECAHGAVLCGVDTRIFTRSLGGRESTGEKATTRRVAVLLYLYIAALEGLEEAGHPFAEMRWLRYMQKVRANAQVHARLFAHALARETERTVTAGARAMH